MASPITHIILVNETQNYFSKYLEDERAEQLEIIFNKYPGELNLGAISPDLLYFTEGFAMKTLSVSNIQDMHKLADHMHTKKTNGFLIEGIQILRSISDKKLKEKLFSFLSGHLAHVIADGIIHPFIRDKVGDYSESTKLNHRMLEMRLDVYVTENLVGLNMNDCKFAEYLDCENFKDIAKFVTSILNTVYSDELSSEYGAKLEQETVEGAIDASRKALKSSSGNFNLKWYLGDLLEKIGLKHPDLKEIKKLRNDDLILRQPVDKLKNKLDGNFLKKNKVHFLEDVCPQFIEKYIEKVDKLYRVVFSNEQLSESDFPAINLDTGRMLDKPDYYNTPFYWS